MTGKIDEVKDGLQEIMEQLTQATQELTEKMAEATNKALADPTFQKDKDATDNVLDSLTEKDLVVKANTAMDLMGILGMDKPWHTLFIGAKKL